MRSGACTIQQTLTAEAASILKHSLTLARRRGHAQVTPLHVAATLLSSRTSLLRKACLKSQPPHQTSHPLQCRALELCFNVALNRLPTTPGPLLHGAHQPSLSNALIAALKRAQAHQRRGCVEQQQQHHQQQPLLSIKVELEQLLVSILDDPSVSRVMREAGFSSTAVKSNIEDSSVSSVFHCYGSSGGVFSSPSSPSRAEAQRDIMINPVSFWQRQHQPCFLAEQLTNPVLFSPQKVSRNYSTDIKLVLEVFLKEKKKNVVLVGDSVSSTEGLVGELMGRIERGDVPSGLKHTQFIKFDQFAIAPVSLRFLKKEDVEKNLSELKMKVNAVGEGGGVIIYTGDLKWTVDQERLIKGDESSGYSPVDHLVAEIGRLVCDYSSSNKKVWLMGIASYQTYMKCQMRQPRLEIQWALQAVSVPSAGLGLSLHASSVENQSHQVLETNPFISKEENEKFICCPECNSNYEKEAQLFKSGHHKQLLSWLQPQPTNLKDQLDELKRKWNSLCHSLHHQPRHIDQCHLLSSTLYNNQGFLGKTSSHSWWPSHSSIFRDSDSISFQDSALKPNQIPSHVPKFRRQQSAIDFIFSESTIENNRGEPSSDALKSGGGEGKEEVKISLALGNSLFSDDLEKLENETTDLPKSLQENVPWQSEIVPCIAQALAESAKWTQKHTWLLIQGNDTIGKRRLALAIAESVFGSAGLLLHMNMGKRRKEETLHSEEILAQALRNQERLVVLVEDVDLADAWFLKFLADGFQTGKFGEEANTGRVIFLLTRGDSLSCEEKKIMANDSVIQMTIEVNETGIDQSCKRKAEWEISNKTKNPRATENKDAALALVESENKVKKDFSRQSSFNILDLNRKADEEDDESQEKHREFRPISSDLTREATSDHPHTPNGFLDLIKNRFVFDQNQAQHKEMKVFFLSKINKSFEEVFGDQNLVDFSVEDRAIDELLQGSGSFVNSQFEKWLKDIFQTSLKMAKIEGKEGIGVKLCFRGRGGKVLGDGFIGTFLPWKIQVCFVN